MGLALFITFVFMHIAFGLALAFFILYFADKSEGWLKSTGFFTGGLLLFLTIAAMITAGVFIAKNPHMMPPPSPHHDKMQHQIRMMREDTEDRINESSEKAEELKESPGKKIHKTGEDVKQGEKTGGACPINARQCENR